MTVLSKQNQPLKVKVDLLDVSDEELDGLSARISPSDAEQSAISANLGVLLSASYVVEPTADRAAALTITTEKPYTERSVNMIIELAWPAGRAVKEYSFLLDPSEQAQADLSPTLPILATQAPSIIPQVTVDATPNPIEELPAPVSAEVPSSTVIDEPLQPQAFPPLAIAPEFALAPAELTASAPIELPFTPPNALTTPTPYPNPTAKPSQPVALTNPNSTEYQVVAGDTLSSIASRYPVQGLNLDQMLVGFYRLNAYLFVGRNMNKLEVGTRLQIPNEESIEVVPTDEARFIVDAQYADYRAEVRELSGEIRTARSSAAVKAKSPRLVLSTSQPADLNDGSTRVVSEEAVAAAVASSNASASLQEALAINSDLKNVVPPAAANTASKRSDFDYLWLFAIPLVALLFILIYLISRFRSSSRIIQYDSNNVAGNSNDLNPFTFRPNMSKVAPNFSVDRSEPRSTGARAKLAKESASQLSASNSVIAKSTTLAHLVDRLSPAPPPTVLVNKPELEKTTTETSINLVPLPPEDFKLPSALPVNQSSGSEATVIDQSIEMTSKYDLALAYLDLGEKDTAIDLLNEVSLWGDKDISQAAALLLSEQQSQTI